MSTRRRRANDDAEARARSTSRAASSTSNARRRGDVGRPREGDEDGRAERRGGRPPRVLYASLFVIWGAVLHHGEVYSHVVAQRRCSWPHGANGTRVMVTADPQLVDEYTYRELGRRSRALAFAEAVCDAYVRWTMKAGLRRFAPRNVVFLGDLFGQGARRNDDEWRALRRRVDAALWWPRNGDGGPLYHTVAGNHDVGYSEVIRHHPRILARFEEWYGKSNFVERIGGVDFVGVNAMVLDGKGPATDETWAFVDGLSAQKKEPYVKRVLVTHLPLPNPSQRCGPFRNSQAIQGRTLGSDKEIIYQDYLSDESAQRLLRAVEPVLVLSGHDHDQCEVTHAYESALAGGTVAVTEITVGTVSALNGNDQPSYLMLTVPEAAGESFDVSGSGLIQHKLCFLPEIREILRTYAHVGVVSVLTILGPPLGELIAAAKKFEGRPVIALCFR